jgi:hypothetical protein
VATETHKDIVYPAAGAEPGEGFECGEEGDGRAKKEGRDIGLVKDNEGENKEKADADGETFRRHIDGFDREVQRASQKATDSCKRAEIGEFRRCAKRKIHQEEEDDPGVTGEEVGEDKHEDEERGEPDLAFAGGDGGGAHGAKVRKSWCTLVNWWTNGEEDACWPGTGDSLFNRKKRTDRGAEMPLRTRKYKGKAYKFALGY